LFGSRPVGPVACGVKWSGVGCWTAADILSEGKDFFVEVLQLLEAT
jgi:hypothetical protein